jgi:hypothetical protein
MKVRFEIECSPEEARRFFGLPDVTPVNEMLVEEMKKRTQQNMNMLEPDALMRAWMNFGGQAQEQFFKIMSGAMTGPPSRT